MNFYTLLIVFCCLALVIGAILVILQSAKKFKLTATQKEKIRLREQEQRKKDKDNE
ncbi:DUF2897 family protein [Thalassotalea sediminis]|uniref:DUF2897 family protein n=1 Tax=Thalassotalea sediminis TaxID=1759089 RepID=UPI002572E0F4|nr:DUF2897 family protein [Thalassotalea sediminis]